MIKTLKKTLTFLKLFQSVKSFRFYDSLLQIALYGMNKGSGSHVESSGELYNLKKIQLKHKTESSIIIFDVGANIGNYTKMILDVFKNVDVSIHCFEPSFKTFQALCSNIIDERVIKNNFGLSSNEEIKELFMNKDLSGIASVYNRNLTHFNIDMTQAEKSRFTSLDQYCKKNLVNNIFFLKIDVEGHELEVFKGANSMLPKIKYIQFEFGGSNIDSRTYFQDFFYLLKEKEFDIFLIMKDGLILIDKYSERLEIFTTTNFMAINKKIN